MTKSRKTHEQPSQQQAVKECVLAPKEWLHSSSSLTPSTATATATNYLLSLTIKLIEATQSGELQSLFVDEGGAHVLAHALSILFTMGLRAQYPIYELCSLEDKPIESKLEGSAKDKEKKNFLVLKCILHFADHGKNT